MQTDELEAQLQRLSREIAALKMGAGPLYRNWVLPARRRSWKPYAEPKTRSLSSPRDDLKEVQRLISELISNRFEAHPIAHAYEKGRGIVTNARQHVRKEWLFHVDLLNFFGMIKEEVVAGALHPVLPTCSAEYIGVLARLCCLEGSLPQGSPASPRLSNLVCFALDQRLQGLGDFLGLTVTRYSDDVCFSSNCATLPNELATVRGRGAHQHIKVGRALSSLFEAYGFEINFSKVRFQDRTERQQVTGLVVNERVNVPKEFYRTIRARLRLWELHGPEVAAQHFERRLSAETFVTSLRSYIGHLGYVTGRGDNHYCELLAAYKELKAKDRLTLSVD